MEPRCPHCNANGMSILAAKPVGQFSIVFCSNCGAMFGVVPVIVSESSKKQSCPTASEKSKDDTFTHPIKPAKPENDTRKLVLMTVVNANLDEMQPYTPERMQAKIQMMRHLYPSTNYRVVVDDGPPFCPQHNADMVELTIPAGLRHAGHKIWYCPNFIECGSWELAE